MVTQSVYVSYKWSVDDRTKIIDKIKKAASDRALAIGQHPFNLKRDKDEIGPGDSIPKFMDVIGSARKVIVVLSQEYLESYFCMYELIELFENGKFSARGEFFGVVPVFVGFTTVDAFVQKNIHTYWNEKKASWLAEKATSGLPDRDLTHITEKILLVDRIHRALSTLVSALNSTVASVYCEETPVWLTPAMDRLAPNYVGIPGEEVFYRLADADFLIDVKRQLVSLLDEKLELRHLLAQGLKLDDPAVSVLVDRVLSQNPVLLITQVLYSPLKQMVESQTEITKKLEFFNGIKSLVELLVVMSVHHDWIVHYDSHAPKAMRVEMPVKTVFGVSVLNARFRQSDRLGCQATADSVVAQGAINLPKAPAKPDVQAEVDAVLIEAYKAVYPEVRVEAGTKLNEIELDRLRDNLTFEEMVPGIRRFLPISIKRQQFYASDEFYNALRSKLPSLCCAYFENEGGIQQGFLVQESMLEVAVRKLLALEPSGTGKN